VIPGKSDANNPSKMLPSKMLPSKMLGKINAPNVPTGWAMIHKNV